MLYLLLFCLNGLAFLCLLRFTLQVCRANYYHPYVQLLVKSTNFVVIPSRYCFRPVYYDYSCVFAGFLVLLFKYLLLINMVNLPFHPIVILLRTVLDLILISLQIYFYSLVIYILVGLWGLTINPSTPIGLIQLVGQKILRVCKPLVWRRIDFRVLLVGGVLYMAMMIIRYILDECL